MAKTVQPTSEVDRALAAVVAGAGPDAFLHRMKGWSISRSSGEVDMLMLRVVLMPGEAEAILGTSS